MTYPWLKGPVTSTAYGWRLDRNDGVSIGFTSHDRNIEIGGLVYRASPGLAPTSITQSLGLEPGSLEVSGALTSDALRAEDIEAGRWDGARLQIFLFDWNQPEAEPLTLAEGLLGAISWSGSSFEAEFLGPAALLSALCVPSTSPTCRASFAGSGCDLNPQRYTSEMTVNSGVGTTLLLGSPLTIEASAFVFGELRWLSGPNCGLRQRIASASTNQVILMDEPAFAVTSPQRVELMQGCDRTLATCAGRFGNALNFRGEPHLPGNDLLTRYPGAN
ncbi:MAG TPA: DUF2163 domain-containing protein [Sphingorhabdus sp.]|nr:DUF2163 domain-containing protein [Sphingorhabdus sp.]